MTTPRESFEKFLEHKILEADDYACGVTPDEEDIAKSAWYAAVEWALEEAAKRMTALKGNSHGHYGDSVIEMCSQVLRDMK